MDRAQCLQDRFRATAHSNIRKYIRFDYRTYIHVYNLNSAFPR